MLKSIFVLISGLCLSRMADATDAKSRAARTPASEITGILLKPSAMKVSSYRENIIVTYENKSASVGICRNSSNNYGKVSAIAEMAKELVAEAQKEEENGGEIAILFNPFTDPADSCGKQLATLQALFQVVHK